MSIVRNKTFNYNDGEHTVATQVTYRFTPSDPDPTIPVSDVPLHKVVQTVDGQAQEPLYMNTAKLKDYLAKDDEQWAAYFEGLTEPALDVFLATLGFS